MAKLCAAPAVEAYASSCTESELGDDYLKNLLKKGRRWWETHGHIAGSRALDFDKDPVRFMKALLEQPEIQVNSGDLDGITLLLKAVITKNEEVVRMLLAHPDVDSNVGNVTTGDAPLHLAAKPGSSPEILDMLLDSERRVIAVLNRDEQTPLHASCKLTNRGSDAARVPDVIRKLVKSADEPGFLQKTDVHGRNALHYAGESGLRGACELLLTHDHTLPLVHDNEGFQAVHLATRGGHLQVVELLLPHGRGREDDIVQECQQAKLGCSLDPNHCSTLILAQELLALTRHHHIAEFLLTELKSRIEVKQPQSLFHWAVTVRDSGGHGARLIPHILKWQPERANAPLDDSEKTALHVSAIAGNHEAVEALCRANGGWNLNGTRRDDENKTALDHAFEEGHEDVCRILLERSDVKEDLAIKRRNRDTYAIAAHAVLVVSVLIVPLTYEHCLTGSEVQKRRAEGTLVTQFRLPYALILTKFAFFLSIASTILAAFAALPFSFGIFFVQTVDDRYLSSSLLRTRRLMVAASNLLMLALGAIVFSYVCSQYIAPFIDYQCELACEIVLGLFVMISLSFLSINVVCFLREKRIRGTSQVYCPSDVSEEDQGLQLLCQSGSQQSV